MIVTSAQIDVSYSQLAVFWSSLAQPFNDWTQRHVEQGFSWRPGSVSFKTLVETGLHRVQVDVVDRLGAISEGAVRVIDVPFEVPADGNIDIASISDAVPLSLPAGLYSLRCEFFSDALEMRQVRLVFAKADEPKFSVVRADDELVLERELLTTAEPAAS